MCLYITTSKGLYNYNINTKKITKVIGNWHKGIFNKPSKGFFGICANDDKNQIIIASREKISKNLKYSKSTDLILHFYNPSSKIIDEKITINNLYDIHQIHYFNKKIYLTDTGMNRVQVYNCETKKIEFFINIGPNRSNSNHVNAIFVNKNKILIGLNNGNKENFKNAQIIELNNIIPNANDIDALNEGKLIDLKNVYHTHDIENIGDDYLISASEDGNLISFNSLSKIKNLPIWTRGITKSNEHIFVGKSGVASRKLRHSRYYDGMISILDRKNFDLVEELKIPKIGQLNDILYYEE